MNTLIHTTEIENFTEKQMNARKNLFIGLADVIIKGKIPERKIEAFTAVLDQYLVYEDLKRMTMEEVYKFTLVCEDVSMTDFFPRRELAEAGYINEEELFDAEFEAMYL